MVISDLNYSETLTEATNPVGSEGVFSIGITVVPDGDETFTVTTSSYQSISLPYGENIYYGFEYGAGFAYIPPNAQNYVEGILGKVRHLVKSRSSSSSILLMD